MYRAAFLALGAVVAIGGAAGAWLFQRASAEEIKRHEALKREQDELVRTQEALQGDKNRSIYERKVNAPQAWMNAYKKELELLRQKDDLIRPELQEALNVLKLQARSPAVDAFRRRLLRRELLRFEEALRRLDAYPLYLDWYEKTLRNVLNSSSIGEVYDFGLPSAITPDTWLYPGKLVHLPTALLGKPLSEFGHSVHLSRFPSSAIQKEYFFRRETSPVLIEDEGDSSGRFKGCALKGSFYYDHFIKNIPASFKVVATGKDYCRGTIMEGAIWAILLKENMAEPGMLKFKGETLQVYLEDGSLLLNGNYSGRANINDKTLPIVSEFPQSLSGSDSFPLFLLMNSSETADEACKAADDTENPFTLIEFKNHDGYNFFLLSKNGWHFLCKDHEEGWLVLLKAEKRQGLEERGLNIPLLIIPAELELKSHLMPNYIGLSRFIEHANRLVNMEARSIAASEAVEFFDKWSSILDFLQDKEGRRELLFSSEAQNIDKGWNVNVSVAPEELEEFLDDYERECMEQWSPDLFLQVQTERGAWHTLAKGRLKIENGSIAFHSRRFLKGTNLYRLSFHTAQYAPLEKQRNALAALRDERFVSPYVREALLLPQKDFYKPKVAQGWLEFLSDDSVWTTQPTILSPNQKEVVRGCLSTYPLVLVQGPPGTGKTRCILEMVYQFIAANPNGRVLISSQQNTAVDNVIDRLTKCHDTFLKEHDVKILRIGTENKMSETAQQYTFEAIKLDFSRKLKSQTEVDEPFHEKQDTFVHPSSDDQADTSIKKLRKDFAEYIMPMLLSQNQDSELLYCLTRTCQIVAGTCVGLASKIQALENCHFDLVIIDEAGRALPSELLIPIQFAEKVVLIGDHYQLPPCVDPLLREEESLEELPFLKEAFLDESFFGSLFEALPNEAKFRLSDQYRMDNAIGELVADLFYTENGKRMLHNGAQATKKDGKLLWADVKGIHERNGTSLYNELEIEGVIRLLDIADKLCQQEKLSSVAVITPYREQKKRLIQKKEEHCFSSLKPENILINTVDQFQGSEADAVIYSTVRTSGSMNFLLDRKRLNVACSRARHFLFFVGRKDYFQAASDNNLFAEIISRCRII